MGSPSALAFSIALGWACAGSVLANPTGGVVVAGQASMTSNGSQLLVTTQNATGTNHSAINWQSFSIPTGSSTYFQQPTAASTVINRVVTSTPSLIFGTLGSNGNVVLVNQSGITVGAGAVVDTAGFTASALRMSDADAIAGRMYFGDDGVSAGAVIVNGSIVARSGDVVLLAANVSTGQDALIQAPNGNTLLAAGQKIGITGRGLEGISLEVQAPSDSVVNLGTLKGDAVGIFASTLKHSGVAQANAVTYEGGKVVLRAASHLEISGLTEARAMEQKGGSILASAQHVDVKGTAVLDASGVLGGGEVLVGGGYQGHDSRLVNSQTTTVREGAQLRADAITQGDGGTVVVWSDGATRYAGSLSARGGALGGNGGRAEVSGKQYLDFQGLADLRAAHGVKGSLLLDPENITVGDCADIAGQGGCGYGYGYGSDISSGIELSDPDSYSGASSYITAGQLGSLLATADVTLAANNNIYVNSTVTKSSSNGVSTSLALNAGNDIVLNASIESSADPLNISLTAGNSIYASSGYSELNTKGGNIALQAGSGGFGNGYGYSVDLNTTGNGKGGNISIQSGGSVRLSSVLAYGVNGEGGGAISISTQQGLDLNGNIETNGAVTLFAAGQIEACPEGCINVGTSANLASSVSISTGGSLSPSSVPNVWSSGHVAVTTTATGSFVVYGGSFHAPSISLAAPNGDISGSNFSTNSLLVSAANGISLSSGNSVSNFQASNSGSGGVSLANSSPLRVLGISTAGGDINIDNIGGVTTEGALLAPNGGISINAHSPITIGTAGVIAGGAIAFTTAANDPTSNITLNGTIVSTGGNISFSAGNNLVQNSGVIAAGGITATATGTMTFGPNGFSAGSPLNYSDASGPVNPPLVPLSALVAAGGSVADFLDQFLAALDAQEFFSDDPFDPRNRSRDALVVEGQICTP